MEIHPIANIFPLMSELEFSALKQDIAEHGQRERIILYQGKIIDGRNRFRACTELNIKPRLRKLNMNGYNDSLLAFVLSLNLHRRHLSSSQKAVVALKVMPEFEVQAKANMSAGGGDKRSHDNGTGLQKISNPIDSAAHAAELIGTNRAYVVNAKRVMETAPELLSHVMTGMLTIPDAKKLANLQASTRNAVLKKLVSGQARNIKEAKQLVLRQSRNRVPRNLPKAIDRCQLIHADIRDALNKNLIAPNSIQLCLADPPYGKEYLPLYETLAQLSAITLKPGASLLVMTGKQYLPEVLALMCKHLTYHWCLAYWMPGRHKQLFNRRVYACWKPIVWMTKGKYTGEMKYDVIKSDAPAKDRHDWQQSESGITELVARFSKAGDTVADFFCGTSTTGVAALKLGRKFIGMDMDAKIIKQSRARIHHVISNNETKL